MRQTLCQYVHFFSTPAAAAIWTSANPGIFWVPLVDGFEIARGTDAAVFPAVLEPGAA